MEYNDCICCNCFRIASAKAFDQYGKLTQDLEEQTEMRERAETMAMEVKNSFVYLYPHSLVCSLSLFRCLNRTRY